MKITFMGAGSTVFARNVIGDSMCSEALRDSEFALYDIDGNGIVNVTDVLALLREFMSGEMDVAHDVNKDGSANISDVLKLMQVVVSGVV